MKFWKVCTRLLSRFGRPGGTFQLVENALDQFLCVRNRTGDHLNIHRRFTGLPGALAINAMLANKDQGVGQNVEGNRQASTRDPHHEFVLFQFVVAIVVNAQEPLQKEKAALTAVLAAKAAV
jgi:hypothetical protein